MVKLNRVFSAMLVVTLVLAMAAALLPIGEAKAVDLPPCDDNIYVDGATGDDGWDGTSPVHTGGDVGPKETISGGIEEVCDGGTVHVAAGTYAEENQIEITKSLTLEGADAKTTIIDGGNDDHRVIEVTSLSPNPTVYISGVTIQHGVKHGISHQGGGVMVDTGTLTLTDCTIKDNQAEEGGGIYNYDTLIMNGCTVSGNTATDAGGGIYNSDVGTTMELHNCTISGNQIVSNDNGTRGAGICNEGGTMLLTNCTVANNTTTDPGCVGGGFWNHGGATFLNTIVANNRDGDGQHNNGYVEPNFASPVSVGNNLCGDNCGGTPCLFNQPTDLCNTNPLLGPLQDNGGPTFTHALLHGSPAIDHGSCATLAMDHALAAVAIATGTDQRGVPRPQGAACDIGAYELTQSSVPTATGTGTASFSTTNGYITGLTPLNPSALPCPPRPDLEFHHGLFSLNINGITQGSCVTITITFPSPIPVGAQYWKCQNGNWIDCTSLLGDDDGDNVLTLTLCDGGLGDADGTANGTIVDPGGPATLAAAQAGAQAGAQRASPTLQRPLNPAQVSLQYLSVIPQQTSANQPVTISTNVVNTGDEAGNLNVALKINGQVEESRMVSVGPQGTQPVKFTVTKAQPGTYSVDIGGQKGSFIVTGSGGTARTPVNGGMIAILIVGILVLITVVALIARRRPA